MNERIFEQRRKAIDSHVKIGDYFGTLATILDLLKQTIERRGYRHYEDNALLERTRDDLVYLDKNYIIHKK